MTYEELKKKQVGGSHYKKLGVQPWDFYLGGALSHEEWVGYLKGNIVDYLVRKKNGLEDLRKAQHLLDVLVATEDALGTADKMSPDYTVFPFSGRRAYGTEPGSSDRRRVNDFDEAQNGGFRRINSDNPRRKTDRDWSHLPQKE